MRRGEFCRAPGIVCSPSRANVEVFGTGSNAALMHRAHASDQIASHKQSAALLQRGRLRHRARYTRQRASGQRDARYALLTLLAGN